MSIDETSLFARATGFLLGKYSVKVSYWLVVSNRLTTVVVESEG